MAEANDLINLYSRRILALASDVPHAERLSAPDATAMKRSPLCGSTVTVDVCLRDGAISEFGQDVKACALGQASASVLGANAIGATQAEIQSARDSLYAMLKHGAAPPEGKFAALEVLSPAKDYKNRHASILLAYDALLDAIGSVGNRACAGG